MPRAHLDQSEAATIYENKSPEVDKSLLAEEQYTFAQWLKLNLTLAADGQCKQDCNDCDGFLFNMKNQIFLFSYQQLLATFRQADQYAHNYDP